MGFLPLSYNEPVFRPPAEAYSAILQVTIGCSWNKCAFCEMYTSKKFCIRNFLELKTDIKTLAQNTKGIKKIFLADGNAFVLSSDRLLSIIEEINNQFGKIQRISSYALPKDIASKSTEELKEIRIAGLKLLYIGVESGDDDLLNLINKGENYNSTIEGINKAHEAGIDTSIMVINGLGGKALSRQHAINSAKLINEINPKFLSTLTLSLPYGQSHFQKRFQAEYIQQTIVELALELKLFIETLDIENSIFRSDHISNNLVLKGILGRDKEKLIKTLEDAISLINKNAYPEAPMVL